MVEQCQGLLLPQIGEITPTQIARRRCNCINLFQTRIQRIIGFGLCLALGLFFLVVSTFYIPVLVLKARKFALLYTMASVFFIMAFGFLSGFAAMTRQMFSKERLWVSLSYVGCLLATLYFSVIHQSTPLTALFAVAQIIALFWMVLGSVPGGSTGLKFFGQIFKSSVSNTLPV